MEYRNTKHILDFILRNDQNSPDIDAGEAHNHGNVESTADVVRVLILRVGS